MIFSSVLVMYCRTFLSLTSLQWLNIFFIQIKVIYKGVLSTRQARLDLWYKDQNSSFDKCFNNKFSLFQLETKNQFLENNVSLFQHEQKTSFYKQCWQYIVSIQIFFLKKSYIKIRYLPLWTILICYKLCVTNWNSLISNGFVINAP